MFTKVQNRCFPAIFAFLRRSGAMLCAGLVAWQLGAAPLAAQSPMPMVTPAAPLASEALDSFTPTGESQALITDIVRDNIPHEYEKSKHWGNTKEVFAGWKVEREGLKIETRRRWKQVNDGTWQRYKISLIEPDKNFDVYVEKIQSLGNNQVAMTILVTAKLEAVGRSTHYESGVQMYSIGAEIDIDVRLRADVVLTLGLLPATFPPMITVKPEIKSADLELTRFKIRKVGALEGPVIRSLSSTVREIVEDKLADNRQNLIDKLNKSIVKKQDKLRFSLQDFLKTKWGKSFWQPATTAEQDRTAALPPAISPPAAPPQ